MHGHASQRPLWVIHVIPAILACPVCAESFDATAELATAAAPPACRPCRGSAGRGATPLSQYPLRPKATEVLRRGDPPLCAQKLTLLFSSQLFQNHPASSFRRKRLALVRKCESM